MSDFDAAFNALRSRLEANFAALPLYWPNDSREATLQTAPAGFVYSEARLLDEGASSIGRDGQRWHRDRGEFSIYVYVPRGTLVGTAESHAKAIRSIFALSKLGDVFITRRTVGAGQVVEGVGGKFWSVPVIVEWFSDRLE